MTDLYMLMFTTWRTQGVLQPYTLFSPTVFSLILTYTISISMQKIHYTCILNCLLYTVKNFCCIQWIGKFSTRVQDLYVSLTLVDTWLAAVCPHQKFVNVIGKDCIATGTTFLLSVVTDFDGIETGGCMI